jgi:hypothetical protein
MAVTTLYGHCSKALAFFNNTNIYFGLGKQTDWSNPDIPDPPNVNQSGIVEPLGFKKCESKYLVIPDPAGSIIYRDTRRTFMRYIKDINITEAIVHVLNKQAEEPLLNDLELELDESTYGYIENLITKSLNNQKLYYATFLNKESETEVEQLAKLYFTGKTNDIVDISKNFATRMFALLRGNSALSSCDLLVASLNTDLGPLLAILVMDYDRTFKHTVERTDEKVIIKLVKDRENLPKTAGKVQKAAFILPHGSDCFDLMVLDKDSKNNYFSSEFLKSKYVANERDTTKRFIALTEAWITKKHACNAVKAEDARSTVRKLYLLDDEIVLEDLADELYTAESDHEEFLDYYKQAKIPDRIVLDRTWIEESTAKIKLNLENLIKLEMYSSLYHDPNRFEIQANKDGSINFVIKNVMNYREN